MSRVDDLIRDLCPTGVEYRCLSDVGTVVRGKRFVKNDMLDEGVPCVHYGEIYTKYGVSAAASYSFVSEERAKNLRFAQPGDVIIASAGETVEDIGKSVAWLGDSPIAIHDACYAFSSSMDAKFVSYFFASRGFRDQIKQHISSSKISSISTQNVAKAIIPVPPLEVQREIVRILDQFTQLEAELEEELEEELEARHAQFSHYRDLLLNFDGRECERLPLSAVAIDFGRGKSKHRPRNDPKLYGGDYPFIQTGDVRSSGHLITEYSQTYSDEGRAQSKLWPRGTICITIAANIAETGILAFDACFPDSVIGLVADPSKASSHYVEYLLQSLKEHLSAKGQGSAQANINLGTFEKELFPFPPLAEQERIVGILDKFDALVNDLSAGLPAELKARRQQYEYYRDRLLTFEEAMA